MSIDKLVEFIKYELKDKIKEPGETLYSSVDVFTKGDIYFIGTNPGGENNYSIEDDLEKLKSKTTNGYLDEVWETRKGIPKAGQDTLQIRATKLINEIGYDMRNVCSSNLIFFKSRNLDELEYDFNQAANLCWPIHEKILSVVQPKLIIAFGNSDENSPFSYIQNKFKIPVNEIEKMKIGHGNYQAKSFRISNKTINCHFVALPHLSRFIIKNPDIYSWIRNKLNS
jgi:hypothetical protein